MTQACGDRSAGCLKGSEWRVQSFESAETFLEELDKLANGLLVVDVKLPGMSGLELLEKMQETYRSWPSIVMSGSDDEDLEIEAHRLGAEVFLRKPFAPHLVLDALEQVALSSDGKPIRSSG
jgi:FixJ family two-component response regulator